MKAGEIIDAAISEPKSSFVVEHNGKRIAVKEYYHDSNERNEPIIVFVTGRKIKSQRIV